MLREGFVADVTVFDKDPTALAADQMNGLEVSMTIVSGSIEHSKGEPVGATTRTATQATSTSTKAR
jgi:hypothetical protein